MQLVRTRRHLNPVYLGLSLIFGLGMSLTNALATPAPPTVQQAMRLLYGPAYTHPGSVVTTNDPHGVRVNKQPNDPHSIVEYVTPWAAQIVSLGGKTYFIATGQGHAVSDPSDPSFAGHVQSAYISAIWFVLNGDRWMFAGKQQNLTADGSFGEVAGKPGAPFHQTVSLGQSVLLIADEQGYMNQGYSSNWYPVYRFDAQGLRALGAIPSGGDNTGAGATPVIAFSGKIVGATLSAAQTPVVTMAFTGTTALEGKPLHLNGMLCQFAYRPRVAQQSDSHFSPTTPQCKAIIDSGRF